LPLFKIQIKIIMIQNQTNIFKYFQLIENILKNYQGSISVIYIIFYLVSISLLGLIYSIIHKSKTEKFIKNIESSLRQGTSGLAAIGAADSVLNILFIK